MVLLTPVERISCVRVRVLLRDRLVSLTRILRLRSRVPFHSKTKETDQQRTVLMSQVGMTLFSSAQSLLRITGRGQAHHELSLWPQVGTPYWTAPEVILNEVYNERADMCVARTCTILQCCRRATDRPR